MSSFADTLKKSIRARMNVLADDMISGGCLDFAAYRYFVGRVEGLAEAESLLLDLDRQAQSAIDGDDS